MTQSNTPAMTASPHAAGHPLAMLRCHQCDAGNKAERKFCGQCGALLWEPCAQCGVKNPTLEAFCGGCGTKLEQALAARRAKLEVDLTRAIRLRDEGRFDDALAFASKLEPCDHTSLKSLNQQLAELIETFPETQARMTEESDSALAAARQYAEGFDFDRAQSALESIPRTLRSEEARRLLEKMQQTNAQIAELEGLIHRAVKAKETRDVPHLVQKLLALKPDHAEGLNLKKQLEALQRKRDEKQAVLACQKAKECLAQQQYEQAAELAASISESARTLEIQKFCEQIAEIAWLTRDLRLAPVADAALGDIAERLTKMLPQDAAAAKLRDDVAARRRGTRERTAAAIRWAKPPATTQLGLPLEWLGGFSRLTEAGEPSPLVAEHPGRFAVAAGLALQGLGFGPVKANLLPSEKQSLLGRLNGLTRKKSTSVWGLDLGPTALKAVKLTRNDQGQAVLEAIDVIEHEKGLNRPEAENERGAIIANTLATFVERHAPGKTKVCVGLSGMRVLGRFIKLPPLDAAKIPDAMSYEVKHQVPIPIEELVWDYHAFTAPPAANAKKKDKAEEKSDSAPGEAAQHRAVIWAAKQRHAKDHLAPFQEAGLQVELLQSDCTALYTYLVHEYFPAEPAADGVERGWAIVDIGSDATNVVIGSPRCCWFRSFGRGGDDFSRQLMRRFNLTHAQAEQLKKSPAKARRLTELDEAIAPVFAELTTDLQRSLTSFQTEHPAVKIEKLLLCGGGFQMHGLYRYLLHGE